MTSPQRKRSGGKPHGWWTVKSVEKIMIEMLKPAYNKQHVIRKGGNKMPGNELEVCKYLFQNRNVTELKHLGLIREIGAPTNNGHPKYENKKKLKTGG